MDKNILPPAMTLTREKLLLVATEGIDAAKLSRAELMYLAEPEGAQALCDVLDSLNAMKKQKPVGIMITIVVKQGGGSIATGTIAAGGRLRIGDCVASPPWIMGSPAFAHRGGDDDDKDRRSPEMHFKAGRFTVNLQICQSEDGAASLLAVLMGGKSAMWEIALEKNGKIIECRSARETEDLKMEAIAPGEYSFLIRRGQKLLINTPLVIIRESP